MSSPHLHTPSIQVRPSERAARAVNEQQERPRRLPALRTRRIAIAATVAIGLGSGAAAIVPSTSRAPQTISQGPSSALSTPVPRVGATSASFVRRIRLLEARGYVEVACQVDGDLMFNPRTHSYETVQA